MFDWTLVQALNNTGSLACNYKWVSLTNLSTGYTY